MFSTLSVRMFVLAAVVTLAGMGFLAWMMVRMHSVDLEQEAVQGALRISDTLRRSTRYSMLKNRKEDVAEIVHEVGAQPGIEQIRIFNKDGRIVFSTNSDERGNTVDKEAQACTRCHSGNSKPRSKVTGKDLTRIFQSADGHRVLGLITPIYNEASCSRVGCHDAPPKQSVLGVLDVQVSLQRIDQALQSRNQQFLLLTYFLMLGIATTAGVFIWLFVHIPVKALIRGTRQISHGNFKYRISIKSKTEIGHLAKSFNRMAEDLAQAHKERLEWTQTLEQRVDQKTKTLRQAQARLLQSEKLASLGSLSAVVAHEINNPLSGVLTYTKLVRRMLGDSHGIDKAKEIRKYLEAMESETSRCGRIVSNLLAFSRQSEIDVAETDLNAIVEKTLFLIGHKLELQGITLTKELGPDMPKVTCDADQIQQAVFAILINAVEAMADGGELMVTTRRVEGGNGEGPWVEVTVSDTGTGIPEEVMPRLFEPFFTTKENKRGVGLGLSVVYGIVKRHRGRVDVKSEVGRGTTFVMAIPVKAEIAQETLDPETVAVAEQVEL